MGCTSCGQKYRGLGGSSNRGAPIPSILKPKRPLFIKGRSVTPPPEEKVTETPVETITNTESTTTEEVTSDNTSNQPNE